MVGADEVVADQLPDAGGQVGRGGHGVQGLDVAPAELLADHGRRLDHGSAVGAEPVQPGQQQGVDRRRHRPGQALGGLLGLQLQGPAAVGRPQPPLVSEVVDQLLDQQREALGPLVDVDLDRLVDAASQQVHHQLLALPLGQGGEQERDGVGLAARPVGTARKQLVGTGHAEQDERGVGELGHVLDGVEQDRVGPLEVVDDQHQRPAAGQHLQQPLQRPEGVLGQPGVLAAQAEQLGEALGDQRAPLLATQQPGQAGPGLLGRVVGGDPGRLADDLDHRPQGHAVPEGRAVAAQHGGPVAQAGHELVDQPGLADAGRSQHGHQVAAALGGRPLEQPQQQLLLAITAEHGGDRPPDASRPGGEDLLQPPHLLRLGRALDGEGAHRLGLDRVGHQPVGLLAEQDLAGAGRLLEALGQVDRGPGELLLEGPGVADQHVAGVDAEADVELEATLAANLGGQLVQGRAELGGGPHGP
jgi:hypothetical protein